METLLGTNNVPMDHLHALTRAGTNATWRADLQNGDRLTGTLLPDAFMLTTVFGQVTVGLHHVTRAIVLPAVAPIDMRQLPEGLLLYYPFDGDGARATDHSGKRHHGTCRNTRPTAQAKRGAAMSFGGASRVRCPELQVGPGNTWVFWMKLDSVAPSGDCYPCRAGEGPDHASRHNYWIELLDHDQDGKLEIRAGGAAVTYADGSHEFTHANRWYHIAVTVDANGTLRSFVDGNVDIPHANVRVGRAATVVLGDPGFNGVLDEVMLFNRPLSQQEIRRLITTP
jgi:hypothetical protein